MRVDLCPSSRLTALRETPSSASVTEISAPSASLCEPFRDAITRCIDNELTAMSVGQELVHWLGGDERTEVLGRKVMAETTQKAASLRLQLS